MTASSTNPAAPRLHYAWVVAMVTFVVLLVTAGIRATPGVLMVPLEAEFGWNRAVISGAVAINIALFGLIGPFAASVMDRWGAAARDPAGPRDCCRFPWRSTHADAHPVAAHAAVGRARWQRHRRDVDGARGGRRDPMVRRTPRAGDGRALRGQRDGAARLPPAARESGRAPRVAQRDGDRRGGGRPRFRGRAGLHAGSARRSRACSDTGSRRAITASEHGARSPR